MITIAMHKGSQVSVWNSTICTLRLKNTLTPNQEPIYLHFISSFISFAFVKKEEAAFENAHTMSIKGNKGRKIKEIP